MRNRAIGLGLFADNRATIALSQLRSNRCVRLIARGSSMWPWIRSGSELLLVPKPLEEIREGSVVAYERAGSLLVHRLVRITPDGTCEIRGDNLRFVERIPHGNVLAEALVISQPVLRPRIPTKAEFSALCRSMQSRAAALISRFM